MKIADKSGISLSDAELKAGFILFYKMINTVTAKSFKNILVTPWVGKDADLCGAKYKDNVLDLESKQSSKLFTVGSRFLRRGCAEAVYAYLDAITAALGVKLTAKEKKGVLRTMRFADCLMVKQLTYDVSDLLRSLSLTSHSEGSFECHEMAHEVQLFFGIKDTVEHGSGVPELDTFIQRAFNEKPADFFKNGINSDLFYHDRCDLLDITKVKAIFIRKDYVSTLVVPAGSVIGNIADDSSFEAYYINGRVA